MPAAAARAPRPMATRTPLMAMTAVQALCRIAKTIPDQPKTFRREERDSVASEVRSGAFSAARAFCSVVEFSGTTIEFSEGQKLRPIEINVLAFFIACRSSADGHWAPRGCKMQRTPAERERVGR